MHRNCTPNAHQLHRNCTPNAHQLHGNCTPTCPSIEVPMTEVQTLLYSARAHTSPKRQRGEVLAGASGWCVNPDREQYTLALGEGLPTPPTPDSPPCRSCQGGADSGGTRRSRFIKFRKRREGTLPETY